MACCHNFGSFAGYLWRGFLLYVEIYLHGIRISSPRNRDILRISGDGSSKTWRYISTNRANRLHTEKQPISERKTAVDKYIKDSRNVAYIGDYEVGLFARLFRNL